MNVKKAKSRESHEKENKELIHKLMTLPKERLSIFRSIPVNQQGFILLRLSKRAQHDVLKKLKNKEIINMAGYLDPDKTTDFLLNINKRRRKRIVQSINRALREKVEYLLKFDPRTAAGLMSLDYIEIGKGATFESLSKILRKHENRTGRFPAILVVEDGYLLGELPGHVLALHKGKEKVAPYIRRIPSIKHDADENQVIRKFKENPHNKIAVLGDGKNIMGVIYSDDILRLIRSRASTGLYDFAGVSSEEDALDPAFVKVKNRYKWLIINLATAFLAASVVSLFQDTISAFVLLAVYMPIVAGMGGNAGTQTLAVIVRGLALKEVTSKTAKRVIINEMLAGAVNGVINGVIVALVASLWNHSPMLGLIIGLAMIINLIIAGFFGAVIPLVMEKLGKDPASSATIFITTATDVFGFFAFLGLASLLL